MGKILQRQEPGQVLVTVALVLVVLIAFVALAVDVGNFYGQRRTMQNAADAAALAGARSICARDGTDPRAQAELYAEQNGADLDLTEITINGGTVEVAAGREVDTYFAGLIGFRTVEVYAEAAAACGPAAGACGLWPLSFEQGRWGELQCGDRVLLWDDDRADCDVWECETVGDWTGIREEVPLQGRAWVDFSAAIEGVPDACDSSGCGASELTYRLRGYDNKNQPCLSFVSLPYCIAGATGSGVAASAWMTAGNQQGRIVSFPLYTSLGCVMDHDPGNACGNQRFYVETIGCARVLGAERLCPKGVIRKNCNGPRVIVVEIPCVDDGDPHPDCNTACGGTAGGEPRPGEATSVSLLK